MVDKIYDEFLERHTTTVVELVAVVPFDLAITLAPFFSRGLLAVFSKRG